MKKVIFSTVIFSCLLVACTAKSEKNEPFITYQEYHKIERGMTYEEVQKIVGSEGNLDGDPSTGDFRSIWDGKVNSSFAAITFRNDEVLKKHEQGIASRQ